MNISLQMPFVGPSFQGGRVIRWSKQEGEAFVFGEEICVVSIEQVAALRKTQTASILTGSRRRRRKRVRDELEMRHSGGLAFELVASEPGTVGRIVVDIGESVRVGDVIAVLQTGTGVGAAIPASGFEELPPMRVVANPIDTEDM